MKKELLPRLCVFFPCAFIVLVATLLLFRKAENFSPWNVAGIIEFPTYADWNGSRQIIIENSEKSILIIGDGGVLLYKISAGRDKERSFSIAKFAILDDYNNLYILDADFNGAHKDNIERVLQYSPKGNFIREIYSFPYSNDDFIITKGKIGGMAWFNGSIYLVRLGDDGFWLEQAATTAQEKPEQEKEGKFFHYPDAFRDLVYFHIDAQHQRLTATTKAGGIKHYDFSGNLIFDIPPERDTLPWTAVYDGRNGIIYSDIMKSELVRFDMEDKTRATLFTAPPGASAYYRINYANGRLLAASYDNILVLDDTGEEKTVDSYTYFSSGVVLRAVWFALFILAVLMLLGTLTAIIVFIIKKKLGGTFKRIILVSFCIAFGAIIASILIINEMKKLFYARIYNDLQNISRLIAVTIDTDTITSLSAPGEYEDEAYLRLKKKLKAQFSELPFYGEGVYQIIWMERDGIVYLMYDLENSAGIFYPAEEYEGSNYQKAAGTKEYVYARQITSEGSWVFTIGPLFDDSGNVAAAIETGYDLTLVEEQIRSLIVQTVLIVVASTIAFLLLIIECILIFNAYKKSKIELTERESLFYKPDHLKRIINFLRGIIKKPAQNTPALDGRLLKSIVNSLLKTYRKAAAGDVSLPFRPELMRALIFFLFVTGNLSSAILPMYAANLYQPLFGLPKEFVVTLPFIADTIAAVFALLFIPLLLEKTGVKRLSLIAVIFVALANMLCFIATNTLFLSIAFAMSGFAGGTLILVFNTIIGGQKTERDINSGFAHFNASYLAGINVGVVLGSILAQFLPYRFIFIFSSGSALLMFAITVFSLRSKTVNYMYEISYAKKEKGKKFALLKFVFRPLVLGSLFLLLLPYTVSLSFTSYFMPVFGIEHGLTESNIGQLILLNGLLAILFGTTLCEYILKKLSVRLVIAISLVLNLGAIYLFSIHASVEILIITIFLLSIANIFAATNIQTYYASLFQDDGVSSTKALSIYSAVENFSMAVGPVVFSYILAGNTGLGTSLLAGVLLACLAVFMLISTLRRSKR
jgi:predicted MFS family arabinose efflux permease